MDYADVIKSYIRKTQQTIGFLNGEGETIEEISDICYSSLANGNKLIFCGNGGSAADSQHLAAEFMGRFLMDRDPVPALALTTDTSALTAIGNDYGYDQVFARQLRGIGSKGDVLVGISTSGNSGNVVNAIHAAKAMGITTVGFTGSSGGAMGSLCNVTLRVPSDETNHIQECHITTGHLICKIVEERMFG